MSAAGGAAIVTCARCGNTRQGAGKTGIPGALGEEIEQRVCAECWSEWLATQIRVINHYGPIPGTAIVGRPVLRYAPLRRFGLVR